MAKHKLAGYRFGASPEWRERLVSLSLSSPRRPQSDLARLQLAWKPSLQLHAYELHASFVYAEAAEEELQCDVRTCTLHRAGVFWSREIAGPPPCQEFKLEAMEEGEGVQEREAQAVNDRKER